MSCQTWRAIGDIVFQDDKQFCIQHAEPTVGLMTKPWGMAAELQGDL